MMRSYFLAVFILGLGFAPGLRADEPLNLNQAMEQARQHNPELRKLRLAADAASWKKLEAISAYVPHMDIKGTHFLDADYSRLSVLFGGAAITFPGAFPQSEVDLEASWMIFDGFGAWGGFRASSLEAEAAELEARHVQNQLEQAVRIRFYKALAAQQLAAVADQNISTLEQHARLAEASEQAGFATRVDVLRIGSQLEEARAEKLLTQDNVALARRDLDSAMGVTPQARPLEGALPVPDAVKVPADLNLDVSQREDFLALQRREAALQSLQGAAVAGIWAPKVALFGAEQYYKYGAFDPAILPNDSFQNAYAYGLRFSWALFNGGADWAKYQQSKDFLAQAHESQQRLSLTLADEFEAAKRHYLYNAALYQARLRSVEKSEESVRLATIGVQAGSQTNAQALDAELDLFRARAGVIQAQENAAEALAYLEYALGHTL